MISRSELACLAVLTKQPLVRNGCAWRALKWNRYCRGFANQTIKALLDRGLVRRIGDRIYGLSHANDNHCAGFGP